MITKEEVLQILYKHSRNSGDYVPDYNFDKVAEEISNFGMEDEADQWEAQRGAMFDAWKRKNE